MRKTLEVVTSRWFVKLAFLAYFLFAVVQLLRFERWARGTGTFVRRPESVAGMLPIGHFTSFFAWLRGGGWDTFLPAGLVIILGALTLSVLYKRGFCGWLCPVGIVWEGLAALGRRVFGKNVRMPRWLDLVGRGFRYVLAGGFMSLLLLVPLQEAVGFRELPYMWVADLKIIHLMAEPAWLITFAVGAVATVAFGPVWCRYACPLGGLYSAVGSASVLAVKRDSDTCIHCHKCSEVCHAAVVPEKATRVWAPECDGCMDCVKACPVEGCLTARGPAGLRIEPWMWAVLVVATWLAIWGIAKALGQWDTSVPPEAFKQVINSGLLEQRTRGFF
jgi:polyferredoxin